jgi:HTH-type transcriptional regulator / antitoxin HigA
MSERIPAEVFPPGEFIKEELEARGWTQADLAEILGRPPRLVSEIVGGKRTISPETAKGLGDAFGTGAQFWMNLESTYQLARVKDQDDVVARRARLYSKAPVKEMIKRRWIEPSNSVDVLEKQIVDFFELTSLDEEIQSCMHAARKSTSYMEVTPTLCAWFFRAKKLARAVQARHFTPRLLEEGLEQLRLFLQSPEEVRHVPRVLAESGVRFVVLEPLPQTRIDGVCFWLDETSPVVALSFRYDRIDWFWFTLLHELEHVKNGDGLEGQAHLDVDLVGEHALPTDEKPESEQQADRFAAHFLIPEGQVEDFVARVRPLYSKQKILGFAARLNIHPGIVVGQLQRRKEISYAHNRDLLVKVREHVTSSALAEGWGHFPPVTL